MKVNKGIKQPSSFNPDAQGLFKISRPQTLDVWDYVDGIKKGNRTILSKAITLIESSLPKHQELAREIVEKCLLFSGNSIRVGITGVPGVGKSTFIEALGKQLTSDGHKLAVLAIDPSSQRTKGSILGDKTRMADLAVDKNAFIRPSPSAGTLGGVARKTKEIIVLCEAAGFDVVFIETVGVGQSETAVHSMVDFFLLLMLAGAGDELQGIKRGIMEMADAIIINKADGDNIKKAELAKREYENALHLFPASSSGWVPKAGTCSALSKDGVAGVWEIINEYGEFTKRNGFFSKKRQGQEIKIMFETIKESLDDSFKNNPAVTAQLPVLKEKVLNGNMSSYKAARELLDVYFGNIQPKDKQG
ncbi:MAG: methylmalonyl Co-A mutase-associated GTPase MeaB [Chlorobi bacterium]|nr:methylmalonyl Co-A mutase-associated GTPase MeaB [Chlorobiota bacterium]